MRSIGTWFADHPWTVSVVTMFAAIVVSLGFQNRADEDARARDRVQAIDVIADRARNTCDTANETRELIRTIGVQSDVATATASTEALIIVASTASPTPPDPALLDELRRTTIDQATERSTAIYDQLQPRDCKTEESAARRDAERALNQTD